MWTDEDRVIAASLIKNPQTMEFLKKVYCPERSKVRAELERNVALSDESYGSLMRSLVLAEAHFETAHANIIRIAAKEATKKTPIAPA